MHRICCKQKVLRVGIKIKTHFLRKWAGQGENYHQDLLFPFQCAFFFFLKANWSSLYSDKTQLPSWKDPLRSWKCLLKIKDWRASYKALVGSRFCCKDFCSPCHGHSKNGVRAFFFCFISAGPTRGRALNCLSTDNPSIPHTITSLLGDPVESSFQARSILTALQDLSHLIPAS